MALVAYGVQPPPPGVQPTFYGAFQYTDHRLIWADIEVTPRSRKALPAAGMKMPVMPLVPAPLAAPRPARRAKKAAGAAGALSQPPLANASVQAVDAAVAKPCTSSAAGGAGAAGAATATAGASASAASGAAAFHDAGGGKGETESDSMFKMARVALFGHRKGRLSKKDQAKVDACVAALPGWAAKIISWGTWGSSSAASDAAACSDRADASDASSSTSADAGNVGGGATGGGPMTSGHVTGEVSVAAEGALPKGAHF